MIGGGGLYAVHFYRQAHQSGVASIAAAENNSDAILATWKRGEHHPLDRGCGPIFNLSSWTRGESQVNERGTRIAVRYSIDSATQAGSPVRVNWTFAWINTGSGWSLHHVFQTDQAPPMEAWEIR